MTNGFGPRDRAFIRGIYDQALESAGGKGMDPAAAQQIAARTASVLASKGLGKPVFLEDVLRVVREGR